MSSTILLPLREQLGNSLAVMNINNRDSSRPGEKPNGWKQFGPKQTRAIEPLSRPPVQRGILDEGLGGRGRVGCLFGARRFSPVGLGPVTLKKRKSTHNFFWFRWLPALNFEAGPRALGHGKAANPMVSGARAQAG